MKKLWLLAIVAIFSMAASAQKANIETAAQTIRKYNSDKESSANRKRYLTEAKKAIDAAHSNATTSNDPRMWLMRAKVYYGVHSDTLGLKTEFDPDGKLLIEAGNSIIKCKEADVKKRYVGDTEYRQVLTNIAVGLMFTGEYLLYDQKNYELAIAYFQTCRSLIPLDEENDFKRNNIDGNKMLQYEATAQQLAGNGAEARKLYAELIQKGFNDPGVYVQISNILLEEGDTTAALEYVVQGREMFEDNPVLIKREIALFLSLDRSDELMQRLDETLDIDPYNSLVLHMRGILNRDLKQYDKAQEDFKKAVEADESNTGALQDLGEMLFTQGYDVVQEANTYGLNETEKYNAAQEKANALFLEAQGHLEMLREYQPDNNRAAQFLIQIYTSTEQLDKYKALKAELGQ